MTIMAMARIHSRFKAEGIKGHVLGSVHDAINFEIHRKSMKKALPLIKHEMEHLPLDDLFNLQLDVPMVADFKVGSHWGHAKEIPETLVERWDPEWVSQ